MSQLNFVDNFDFPWNIIYVGSSNCYELKTFSISEEIGFSFLVATWCDVLPRQTLCANYYSIHLFTLKIMDILYYSCFFFFNKAELICYFARWLFTCFDSEVETLPFGRKLILIHILFINSLRIVWPALQLFFNAIGFLWDLPDFTISL